MPVTIKTIARATGLSLTTVSKYLNGGNVLPKNRVAIESAVEKYGYRVNYVAKNLKTGHTNTVGIVLPSFQDVFHTGFFHYIEHYLRKQGYSVQVVGSGDTLETEKRSIRTLLSRQVDAVFLFPVYGAYDNAKEVVCSGIPLVIGDQYINEVDADYVLFDNRNVSCRAVSLFVEAGHEKIAVVSADKKYYTANERFLGYLDALKEGGISFCEEYAAFCSDFNIEQAKEAVRHLLDLPSPPTAFFATNFYMTVGMIAVFNERGLKIGEDVSAIGYDSLFVSDLVTPTLTIVDQPLEEAGRQAAELICRRIADKNGAEEHETVVIPSKLILGNSVKKI